MLRVLAEARAEAIEAAARYDRERFGLGSDFLDEIEQALNRIKGNPQSFPLRSCRLAATIFVAACSNDSPMS